MSSRVVSGWSCRIASCALIGVVAIAASEDPRPIATLCLSGELLVEDLGESDTAEEAPRLVPSGASGSTGFPGPRLIGRRFTDVARSVVTGNADHRRHVSRSPPLCRPNDSARPAARCAEAPVPDTSAIVVSWLQRGSYHTSPTLSLRCAEREKWWGVSR